MTIIDLTVRDIRFPTSANLDGSDAIHVDPDYSCPYVTLHTDINGLEGHGITFTLGRGNEVCISAIESLKHLVIGRTLASIQTDMANFWHNLCNDSQLRWLGPEKGVIHMAVAAIINAIWDLYAKHEGKPLWKLVADFSPQQIVDCIDFHHITDALTPDEALSILKDNQQTKAAREAELLAIGLPAYTSSAGWMGYSDEKTRDLCRRYLADGWTWFKMKVGGDL